MLWARADTLNQDFQPSMLIENEREKQARFNLTETMGNLVKFDFKYTFCTNEVEETS